MEPVGQAAQAALDERDAEEGRSRHNLQNVRRGDRLIVHIYGDIVERPRIDIGARPRRGRWHHRENHRAVSAIGRRRLQFKVRIGILDPEERRRGPLQDVQRARAVAVAQIRIADVLDHDVQPRRVERGHIGKTGGPVDKRIRHGDVVGPRGQRKLDETLRVPHMLVDILVRHGHAVGPRIARIVERVVDDVGVPQQIVKRDAQPRVEPVAIQRARRQRGRIEQGARVVIHEIRRRPVELRRGQERQPGIALHLGGAVGKIRETRGQQVVQSARIGHLDIIRAARAEFRQRHLHIDDLAPVALRETAHQGRHGRVGALLAANADRAPVVQVPAQDVDPEHVPRRGIGVQAAIEIGRNLHDVGLAHSGVGCRILVAVLVLAHVVVAGRAVHGRARGIQVPHQDVHRRAVVKDRVVPRGGARRLHMQQRRRQPRALVRPQVRRPHDRPCPVKQGRGRADQRQRVRRVPRDQPAGRSLQQVVVPELARRPGRDRVVRRERIRTHRAVSALGDRGAGRVDPPVAVEIEPHLAVHVEAQAFHQHPVAALRRAMRGRHQRHLGFPGRILDIRERVLQRVRPLVVGTVGPHDVHVDLARRAVVRGRDIPDEPVGRGERIEYHGGIVIADVARAEIDPRIRARLGQILAVDGRGRAAGHHVVFGNDRDAARPHEPAAVALLRTRRAVVVDNAVAHARVDRRFGARGGRPRAINPHAALAVSDNGTMENVRERRRTLEWIGVDMHAVAAVVRDAAVNQQRLGIVALDRHAMLGVRVHPAPVNGRPVGVGIVAHDAEAVEAVDKAQPLHPRIIQVIEVILEHRRQRPDGDDVQTAAVQHRLEDVGAVRARLAHQAHVGIGGHLDAARPRRAVVARHDQHRVRLVVLAGQRDRVVDGRLHVAVGAVDIEHVGVPIGGRFRRVHHHEHVGNVLRGGGQGGEQNRHRQPLEPSAMQFVRHRPFSSILARGVAPACPGREVPTAHKWFAPFSGRSSRNRNASPAGRRCSHLRWRCTRLRPSHGFQTRPNTSR